MNITLKIEPTFSFSWPMMRVKINDIIIFDGECKPTQQKYFILQEQIESKDKNLLEIEHYNKQGKETVVDSNDEMISDKALILKSIMLDDFVIPDLILHHRPFYVKWTKQQLKEQKDRPEVIKNNLYFGYNGIYKFEFCNDSAKEYYRCLMEKEHIANIHNKKEMVGPDGEKIEVFEFTGAMVDSNKEETVTIDQLYERINSES